MLDSKPMIRSLALILGLSLLPACTGERLSQQEVRKQISEIGKSNLVPNAIEIRRISLQTNTLAIAETNVQLAFLFKRANPSEQWRVDSVRLGDRDWVSIDQLLVAVNEIRRRTSFEDLEKLSSGIANYRTRNGSLPNASDIVALTDILQPEYMNDLIRMDAWGNPITYEMTGASTYRLISPGADGLRGTDDDVILDSSRPATP